MSQTTDEQINEMKNLAIEIEKEELVSSAWIDDWGRFGNFTLMIIPKNKEKTTTTKLKKLVNKVIKGSNVKLRGYFAPDPIKERNKVVGYTRKQYVFDLDYMIYDKESNSFY